MACLFRCISFDTETSRRDDNDDSLLSSSSSSSPSSAIATFSWDELSDLSSNFAHLIGSGGYSNVYLARLPGSTSPAALKIHLGSPRLYQLFKLELHVLLRLRHPNIVRLLGFSDDLEEAGALLLEYLPRGNLQEKLQASSRQALPWRNRTVIAFQLAQALEYLHERCSPQIVHGDIKSSNILLDKHFNCKLCDFGSARVGFSSMVQPPRSQQVMMIGSPGYTDPHYLRTGLASKKMDIYGVGVVLLELVSGKEAFRSEGGEMLVQTAEPLLHEILDSAEAVAADEVGRFVDPRLSRASLDIEEAKAMLGVAALCLRNSPSLRPSASQIVQTLVREIPSLSFLHCHKKATDVSI